MGELGVGEGGGGRGEQLVQPASVAVKWPNHVKHRKIFCIYYYIWSMFAQEVFSWQFVLYM